MVPISTSGLCCRPSSRTSPFERPGWCFPIPLDRQPLRLLNPTGLPRTRLPAARVAVGESSAGFAQGEVGCPANSNCPRAGVAHGVEVQRVDIMDAPCRAVKSKPSCSAWIAVAGSAPTVRFLAFSTYVRQRRTTPPPADDSHLLYDLPRSWRGEDPVRLRQLLESVDEIIYSPPVAIPVSRNQPTADSVTTYGCSAGVVLDG